MGLFSGKKTICFDIPKEQYKTLQVLMNMAKKENPEFDEDTWFSELLGSWIASNWRGTIKKMAYYGQAQKERKNKRVARK